MQIDPAFFGRLRDWVKALNQAGICPGVYMFTTKFLLRVRCPTEGYRFSGANNINGIDDGYREGNVAASVASVTMTATNAITGFQDAYVRKVVETSNDLPNVLWIVSEEAPKDSLWWNAHLIALIRDYEKGKTFQHPIGFAMPENPPDTIVYNSDADWDRVAPMARISPISSCGCGTPRCMGNINDSDHSYCGMWNDSPQVNRNHAW